MDSRPLDLIKVDDRIGSKEVLRHFTSGVAVLKRLAFGDFAFTGRGPGGVMVPVGIERKRVPDLVASMQTGRLAEHQLPGLLESYDQVWLIVEERYRPNPRTGVLQVYGKRKSVLGMDLRKSRNTARDLIVGAKPVTEAAVEGYLISIASQTGVRIMKTDGPAETARFVERLWKWWGREWEGHSSLSMMHATQVRAKAGPVERVAAQIPAVGPGKAARIAKRFQTVEDMVLANEREWLEIDGIGKGVLRAAQEFFRGDGQC